MSTEYLKLTAYVNRASELAECLQADLKAGNKITTKTVNALARFIKAADNVRDMLETITEIDTNLN
jgi:hypothetical protein